MKANFSKRKLFTLNFIIPMILVLLLGLKGLSTVLALNPQPLPVSKGVYRLPYEDGTTVSIGGDHTNHPSSLNRYDMNGQGGGPYTVVAAGAGWIREIVDDNDTFCPNVVPNDQDGDGVITPQDNQQAQAAACNGYSGPSSFCCERDIENFGGTCPGVPPPGQPPPTCVNSNNYVWIEHPNGEWTKYTHMLRGTIGQGPDNNGNPGEGHYIGEWVDAGDPLGIEGDVGIAGGPHVHFEVAVPNYVEHTPPNATEPDPDSPPATVSDWFSSGWLVSDGIQDDVLFEDTDGDGLNDPDDDVNRQNRIPAFCQIGFANTGDMFTAGACDSQCSTDSSQLIGSNPAGNIFYRQVTDTIGNPSSDYEVQADSGVTIRAGSEIVLSPGFHAEEGSYFTAAIGACDSPGAN